MGHHRTALTPYLPLTSFFDSRPWYLMSALEESSRDIEHQFNHWERQLNNPCRQHGGIISDISLGLQPKIVAEGDNKKYRLIIHMGSNFKPEDVKVSVKHGVVTIHGKKESKSEDENSHFYQEVTRKFTLPTNLDMKKINSSLTPDGILKIEALLPPKALPEPPTFTNIPVHLE